MENSGPSRKTPNILIASFIGVNILSFLFVWRFVNPDHPGLAMLCWGGIGTNASVLGVAYTLYQINLLRGESEAILTSSNQTRQQIVNVHNFGGLIRGVKLIHEAQGFLRAAKYELALIRLQDLKEIAANYNGTIKVDQKVTNAQREINFIISLLENQIQLPGSPLDAAHLNGKLERVVDILNDILPTVIIN